VGIYHLAQNALKASLTSDQNIEIKKPMHASIHRNNKKSGLLVVATLILSEFDYMWIAWPSAA
jgi:hypothetical protein